MEASKGAALGSHWKENSKLPFSSDYVIDNTCSYRILS
jgi:hypothetical protein